MILAVHLSKDDPTPPYEQLRRQIVDAISSGVLPTGTQLPTVRQLASDLGVATGTVMRTYTELDTDGLIRSSRGAGTTVVDAPKLTPDEQQARLDSITKTYVLDARLLGATDDQITQALSDTLETGQPPWRWRATPPEEGNPDGG